MRLSPEFLYDVIIPCPELSRDNVKPTLIPALPFFVSQSEEIFLIGCRDGCLLWQIHSKRGFGSAHFPDILKGDRLEFFIDSRKSFDPSAGLSPASARHRFYCLPSFETDDPRAIARVIMKSHDFNEHLSCKGLRFHKRYECDREVLEIFIPLRSLCGYREGLRFAGFAFRSIIGGNVFSFPFEEKDGFLLEDNPLFWCFLDLGSL